MKLRPYQYNDFLLNQPNRIACSFDVPFDWNISGISTTDIPLAQRFPDRVAKNYSGQIKLMNVNLLNGDMLRDDFVIAMDVFGELQNRFIAIDEHGRQWYIYADFIGLTETGQDRDKEGNVKTAAFDAAFAVDDPCWRLLEPSTQTMETFYGVASGTITPFGNLPALPVITITQLEEGEVVFGFQKQRFITLINRSPNPLTNYPVDLTDGGLDTATLVAGGQMLSNGDDTRIYIDGVEVKRWFGDSGFDSASTTIWCNITAPAIGTMSLGANIAGTGEISEIVFENTPANNTALPLLPPSGKLKIDNEIFVYTSRNATTRTVSGITRAQRQTSEGAHTIGDSIYFVPLDIWLYYDNSTIDPYVEDDTYKPLLDLVNSTNTLHIWDTEFYTLEGKRTAAWTNGAYLPHIEARHYTATENTLADPASVVGIWTTLAARLFWKIYNPCGFTEIIEITGKKRSENGVFYAELTRSHNGVTYNTISGAGEEPDPTPGGGWEALQNYDNISLPPLSGVAKAYYLQLVSMGFTGTTGTQQNGMEFGLVSLEVDSAQTPLITLGTPSTNREIHSIIYNAATGYSLEINFSLDFDSYLVIDTREKKITLYDGSNQINALQDFPIRAEWFPLLPGQANEITITEEGSVQYLFEWEERTL